MSDTTNKSTLKTRKRRERLTSTERKEEDQKKNTAKRQKLMELKEKHPRLYQRQLNKKREQDRESKARARAAAKKCEADIPPFANKKVFGKALKKLNEALPKDPDQRIALLKFCLKQRCKGIYHQPPERRLDENTVKLVEAFYNSDDCSIPDPSKKATILVKDSSGNKLRVAKRYMTSSLAESHQLYLSKHPENQLKISKFCELRPKNVHCFQETPQKLVSLNPEAEKRGRGRPKNHKNP